MNKIQIKTAIDLSGYYTPTARGRGTSQTTAVLRSMRAGQGHIFHASSRPDSTARQFTQHVAMSARYNSGRRGDKPQFIRITLLNGRGKFVGVYVERIA